MIQKMITLTNRAPLNGTWPWVVAATLAMDARKPTIGGARSMGTACSALLAPAASSAARNWRYASDHRRSDSCGFIPPNYRNEYKKHPQFEPAVAVNSQLPAFGSRALDG
jgi:hypothetical protein